MRKLITGMVLCTMLGTMGFADPKPDEIKVDKYIVQKLQAAYPEARDITWDRMGDYTLARFTTEYGRVTAYINGEGDIRKVTRYIDGKALPMAVQRALNEQFNLKDREMTVMEVTKENITYYLVSFEHQNRKYIVESDLAGQLNVVKKIKV